MQDGKKCVLLTSHTGGRNRGCEAIIRSTTKLLNQHDVNVAAMTFDIEGDRNVGLDKAVRLIEYPKKSQFIRALSLFARKITGNDIWGSTFYQNEIKKNHTQYDMVINVGGDTYCYTTPWVSITANLEAKRYGLKTVFWGCSIDERLDTDMVLQDDINRYDYIVARESYSYEIICRNYKGKGRVFLACDPAFHLDPVKTALPDGFIANNTVGINISPVMVNMNSLEQSEVYQNCLHLIKYICDNSDMNICLIPHVYQIQPQDRDYKVLHSIFQRFEDNPRVSIISEELSAGEIKYIISKCRFFIGSRTHSVIAAYSSCIPTLALSYSIKSRGLAYDVIGKEKGYAVPWKELKRNDDLTHLFCDYLLNREQELQIRLNSLMPEYKKTIVNVLEEILSGNE